MGDNLACKCSCCRGYVEGLTSARARIRELECLRALEAATRRDMERERDESRADVEQWRLKKIRAVAVADAMSDRIARLETALRVYADPAFWFELLSACLAGRVQELDDVSDIDEPDGILRHVPGRRARQALETIE